MRERVLGVEYRLSDSRPCFAHATQGEPGFFWRFDSSGDSRPREQIACIPDERHGGAPCFVKTTQGKSAYFRCGSGGYIRERDVRLDRRMREIDDCIAEREIHAIDEGWGSGQRIARRRRESERFSPRDIEERSIRRKYFLDRAVRVLAKREVLLFADARHVCGRMQDSASHALRRREERECLEDTVLEKLGFARRQFTRSNRRSAAPAARPVRNQISNWAGIKLQYEQWRKRDVLNL
ncbi:hypothetical protein HYV30_04245 [Candidatus Kaiserbacteria bacterium]|nr:hypothetical protein [Candidatus Kaiserbacteria bacterium]